MQDGKLDKLITQAAGHLDDGEQIIAVFPGRPKGYVTDQLGGPIGVIIGGEVVDRHTGGRAEIGVQLADPMLVAVTDRRLATFSLDASSRGVGDIKAFLGAVPLDVVDAIESARSGLTKLVSLTIVGSEFSLRGIYGAKADDFIAAAGRGPA